MNGASARRILKNLYRAALAGADPRARVSRALARTEVARTLGQARSVGVFAVGKAAAAMLRGARLPGTRGLAVLPHGFPPPRLPGLEVVFASHPVPDRSSVAAARLALRFFESFGREDAILCLVSGGTSSLLALPRPGWTLARKRRAVARLAARGASILELNRLRTRLSAVKGGGLGRATRARLVTLILSDVPGDRPRAVGSGPTIRGFRRDVVGIVASNASGLEAAAAQARRLGLAARVEGRRLSGEARVAGARFARRAKRLRPGAVLLAGGETTVSLPARHGRGGRNLEFALGAAGEIQGTSGLSILAAGSDGRDGSSRATGAFADGRTLERARRRGRDPGRALLGHDTEAFFEGLGGLLETGPTGTNVADWAFALRIGTRRPSGRTIPL